MINRSADVQRPVDAIDGKGVKPTKDYGTEIARYNMLATRRWCFDMLIDMCGRGVIDKANADAKE